MKILHAPVEVAGQVGLEVAGLRAVGHQADAWTQRHAFDFHPGPDREIYGRGWPARLRTAALLPGALRYDVVHLHGGASFLPRRSRYADVPLLRRRGVKVVQHFCGSDARLPETELSRNRWYVNSYGESERENRDRLARWAELTDGHVIFQDHSFDLFLRPYFAHVHVVPLAVDLERLTPAPQSPRTLPIVVHAPSETGFKGTAAVRAAVAELNRHQPVCRYVEVTGRSHAETLAALRDADVVIDQVRAGAYGTVTAEAMAMGKPVICYILPELLPTYGSDFPVVTADPDTLKEVLGELMRSPDDRARIGAASRRYAERVHGHLTVAAQLVDVYRQLP